jgi:hypothetical protein
VDRVVAELGVETCLIGSSQERAGLNKGPLAGLRQFGRSSSPLKQHNAQSLLEIPDRA